VLRVAPLMYGVVAGEETPSAAALGLSLEDPNGILAFCGSRPKVVRKYAIGRNYWDGEHTHRVTDDWDIHCIAPGLEVRLHGSRVVRTYAIGQNLFAVVGWT
jgi:hypothetical protein